MREQGVRPDQYEKFEELLERAGIAHLPRLHPLMIWDVTFWDRAIWASDEMIKLSDAIRDVLFGNSPSIDIATVGIDTDTWPHLIAWQAAHWILSALRRSAALSDDRERGDIRSAAAIASFYRPRQGAEIRGRLAWRP